MKKLIMLETIDKNSPILQGVKVDGYSPRLINISEADEEWLKFGTNIHLYLIDTDAEIKLNDWYIDDSNQIRQSITDDKEYWKTRQDYDKIIASTDNLENIPQLSESSIKLAIDYFNKTGKKEVEVNYTIDVGDKGWNTVYLTIPEEKMYSKEELKQHCTKFFYWWYNHPGGTNTEEGFDKYAELNLK